MTVVRVLVVQAERRYRRDLEELLHNTPGLALVRSFDASRDVLAWISQEVVAPFDVALIDVQLPHISGIELTRELRDLVPGAALVMLTAIETPEMITEAICAGADGYLLKYSSAHELVAQVRTAATGGVPMTATVARSMLEIIRRYEARNSAREPTERHPSPVALTPREYEVLREFSRGASYQEAADELGVSVDTVRSHVRELYGKLKVHSLHAAVARAFRWGLV